MKKGKNRLDEMQEQKMLQIEHNGYWIGYVGLAVIMLAQIFYYGPGCSDKIGGEFLVFLFMSANILVGCIKYGVWDRKFAPTWRMNVFASLIAGVTGGVIRFFVTLFRYHKWQGCAAAGAVMGINIFMCTLVCMSFVLAAYKIQERRREQRLDREDDDNED